MNAHSRYSKHRDFSGIDILLDADVPSRLADLIPEMMPGATCCHADQVPFTRIAPGGLNVGKLRLSQARDDEIVSFAAAEGMILLSHRLTYQAPENSRALMPHQIFMTRKMLSSPRRAVLELLRGREQLVAWAAKQKQGLASPRDATLVLPATPPDSTTARPFLRFLIDADLSSRLALTLNEMWPGSTALHCHDVRLAFGDGRVTRLSRLAEDEIVRLAVADGFTILSSRMFDRVNFDGLDRRPRQIYVPSHLGVDTEQTADALRANQAEIRRYITRSADGHVLTLPELEVRPKRSWKDILSDRHVRLIGDMDDALAWEPDPELDQTLLFDANMSPSVARALARLYPGAVHVDDIGLGQADDMTIFRHALANNMAVVTFDSDFLRHAWEQKASPKVIWFPRRVPSRLVTARMTDDFERVFNFLEASPGERCLCAAFEKPRDYYDIQPRTMISARDLRRP